MTAERRITMKKGNTHQLSRWLQPKSELDSITKQLDKYNGQYEIKNRFNGEGKKEFAVYVPKGKKVNYDYLDKPITRRSR